MNPERITVTNPFRRTGWGWEWTCTPDKEGRIPPPATPYYKGTIRQVLRSIQGDRHFQTLGGTYYNSAWFYRGRRITAIEGDLVMGVDAEIDYLVAFNPDTPKLTLILAPKED